MRDLVRDLATTTVLGPYSVIEVLTIIAAIATVLFGIRAYFVICIQRPLLNDRLLEASVLEALLAAEQRAPDFVAEMRAKRDGSTIPGWALYVATAAARSDVDATTRGEIVDAVFRPSMESRTLA